MNHLDLLSAADAWIWSEREQNLLLLGGTLQLKVADVVDALADPFILPSMPERQLHFTFTPKGRR